MHKLAVRSSIILIIGVALGIASSALIARALGVEGRADFYYLFLPLYFCPVLCGQGYAQFGVYLAKKHQVQSFKQHLVYILAASFVFSSIWTAIGWYYLSEDIGYSVYLYAALTFLSCAIFSTSSFMNALSCLDKKFVLPDLIKVINPISTIVLVFLAFSLSLKEAWIFLLIQIGVRLIELLITTKSLPSVFEMSNIRRSKEYDAVHAEYRKRAWLTALNSLVFLHLDKLVVIAVATKYETGLYAVSIGLAMSASQFVGNLTNIIIARINVSSFKVMRSTLAAIFWQYAILGLAGLIISYLMLDSVISYIFGSEYVKSALFTNLLFLKIYFSSLTWLLAQVFILTGSNKYFLRCQYLGLLVVIATSFLSIYNQSFELFLAGMIISSFSCFILMSFYFIKGERLL